MTAVVDASAAVEIILKNSHANQFSDFLNSADLIIAPDIYSSEITNVFWKYANFSNVPIEVCEKSISACIDLIDDFIETRPMCREVFSEAVRLKHPSYDIFYLSLARRNNAILVTKDKKLKKIAEAMGVRTIQGEI
jgi:predicted nucleic acid-binding protein